MIHSISPSIVTPAKPERQRRRELEPSFPATSPLPEAGFHVAATLRCALHGMTGVGVSM